MNERRQYLPRSDLLETWPRRREYAWALLAALLALIAAVGPFDLEAEQVTAAIVEEEGARRAPANGAVSPLFAGDPRELHRIQPVFPLQCFPPKGEWIRQWGDGRTPYEAHPRTGQRPFVCVDADLRRRTHVRKPSGK